MSQDSKPGSTAAERQPDNVTKYTALPATKGPIPQVLRYDLKKKKSDLFFEYHSIPI